MRCHALAALILAFTAIAAQAADEEMIQLPADCKPPEMSMIQCPLADGVSMDDAVTSMKLRANMLNFKLVAHMPLSEQVQAMGGESKRMEIFQFCDAMIAARMVKYSTLFAGYLPCRVALIEDQQGRAWLITLDMDGMMQGTSLPPELVSSALQVRNNIYNILAAGAEGDL
jgi:uncharacterized protein (DUF302 family)